ncbi:hypothetical protein JW998_10105 [candidate division KSB1 bacterium]|nr:hypothetical protein [candidate division KSB1 bacterium]
MSLCSKTTLKAAVCSLLLHGILLCLSAVIKWRSETMADVEVILEQKPPPAAEAILKEEQPLVDRKLDAPDLAQFTPVADVVKSSVDTAAVDTTGKFDRTAYFIQAARMMFQPRAKICIDSVDTFSGTRPGMLPFEMPKESMSFNVSPGPYRDRIERNQDLQNLGRQQPLSLTHALNEGVNYVADLLDKNKDAQTIRLDFVPSKAQIYVLKTLWEKNQATDIEIYADLDSTIHITAVDLNRLMEKLEEKGLVKRTLVSPRNEFTLPVGKIEMSAKNRRNRVYQYQARIDAGDVLRYLQAVLYETENGSSRLVDDTTHTQFIADLKAKIVQLIEEED